MNGSATLAIVESSVCITEPAIAQVTMMARRGPGAFAGAARMLIWMFLAPAPKVRAAPSSERLRPVSTET